jgi:predicted nucleic acid-binding Zn ribbon protein
VERSQLRLEERQHRHCAHCGRAFTPKNSLGKTCSASCRVLLHRAQKAAAALVLERFAYFQGTLRAVLTHCRKGRDFDDKAQRASLSCSVRSFWLNILERGTQFGEQGQSLAQNCQALMEELLKERVSVSFGFLMDVTSRIDRTMRRLVGPALPKLKHRSR